MMKESDSNNIIQPPINSLLNPPSMNLSRPSLLQPPSQMPAFSPTLSQALAKPPALSSLIKPSANTNLLTPSPIPGANPLLPPPPKSFLSMPKNALANSSINNGNLQQIPPFVASTLQQKSTESSNSEESLSKLINSQGLSDPAPKVNMFSHSMPSLAATQMFAPLNKTDSMQQENSNANQKSSFENSLENSSVSENNSENNKFSPQKQLQQSQQLASNYFQQSHSNEPALFQHNILQQPSQAKSASPFQQNQVLSNTNVQQNVIIFSK
jgi:hypothetical protein